VKSFWILIKQEIMGWQWHKLDHMQIICTLLPSDNHASTSSLKFFRMLFLTPNQQFKALKALTLPVKKLDAILSDRFCGQRE